MVTRAELDRRCATRRAIEAELRAYHSTKGRIADELQGAITPAGHWPTSDADTIRGGGDGDPTHRAAMRLTSAHLLESQRRIAAIDQVLSLLAAGEQPAPLKRRLVELRYWHWYDPERISRELHIDVRTYRRWSLEVIEAIAGVLGWPM